MGGLRPILDQRQLNRSVLRLKFKMLTLKQVVSRIRSEDWFVTIDLKDTYFHVSILSHSPEVPEVCFRGPSVPVSGSYVWPSTLTPHFHEVCVCYASSVAATGHPHTQLHRRLADYHSIRADDGSSSRCRSGPLESA